nr:histone-lysine N-methyltransferase SETMAR-like [Lytechinus pictus]
MEGFSIFAGPESQGLSDHEFNSDFEYIQSNVRGHGQMGTDPQEIEYCGCSCQVPSCGPSCPCLKRYGPNYTLSGKLLQSENRLPDQASRDPSFTSSKPIFECNASCKCGENCVNRLVQRGTHHKMEVFKTRYKGWGVRVLEPIEENEFVCEYVGEVLTKEEAKARMTNLRKDDMNYLFVLRENFEEHSRIETFIDARLKGNIARFINHSCEPNLFLVVVRVHNEVPRVAMFARRDITFGEELSYKYCWNVDIPCDSVNGETTGQNTELSSKHCMCESHSCLKYLPSDLSIY